jgi:hypothetical protein
MGFGPVAVPEGCEVAEVKLALQARDYYQVRCKVAGFVGRVARTLAAALHSLKSLRGGYWIWAGLPGNLVAPEFSVVMFVLQEQVAEVKLALQARDDYQVRQEGASVCLGFVYCCLSCKVRW